MTALHKQQANPLDFSTMKNKIEAESLVTEVYMATESILCLQKQLWKVSTLQWNK